MKNSTLSGFIYALPAVLAFYFLPLISGGAVYSAIVYYAVIPVLAALAAFIFGMRRGRDFSVAAAIEIFLFPSVFLYYDASSSVYIIAYGVIAVVCTAVGARFYRNTSKKDR